jgi:hypothetical protein
MPPMRLYCASDLLVRHREKLETMLFSRIQDLFGPPTPVTLYDLTNTYFEGAAAGNAKAGRGRSKEKRSDCPLVTLGLVLDGSGFVRQSKLLAGHVAESTTLAEMLKGPQGRAGDHGRGHRDEANIVWLKQQEYRYLVVSRERHVVAQSRSELRAGWWQHTCNWLRVFPAPGFGRKLPQWAGFALDGGFSDQAAQINCSPARGVASFSLHGVGLLFSALIGGENVFPIDRSDSRTVRRFRGFQPNPGAGKTRNQLTGNPDTAFAGRS